MYKADTLIILRDFTLNTSEQVQLHQMDFSNNFNLRNKYFFGNEGFKKLAGFLSLKSYEDSTFLHLLDLYIPNVIPNYPTIDEFALALNNDCFNKTEEFLSFLWFIKDNSVSVDSCTTYIENCENLILKQPNYNVVTNSIGFYEHTNWNTEELQQAGVIQNHYLNLPKLSFVKKIENLPFEQIRNKIAMSSVNQYNYNDWAGTRIHRAFGFLRDIRYCGVLVKKIAYYIPLLESLFIDSQRGTNLKAKVSKRAAKFISTTNSEQCSIEELIKIVYDIRSDYYHGSQIKKKHSDLNKLQFIAKELDSLARRILTKVLLYNSKEFLRSDVDIFLKTLSS